MSCDREIGDSVELGYDTFKVQPPFDEARPRHVKKRRHDGNRGPALLNFARERHAAAACI